MIKERRAYIDLLKIIAAFLVVFTHTGHLGSKLYTTGEYGMLRNMVYIMADCFRCINIPLFFMISGVLLLDKEDTYEYLFKKRVFRYIVVTVIFSAFYYLFHIESAQKNVGEFIGNLYGGNTIGLLWFLYTYIGFLLILPFMRKIVKNMEEKDFKYLFLLGFFYKEILDVVGDLLFSTNFGVPCYLITDSIFYPIMGYYINKIEKKRSVSFLLGGFLLTITNILLEAVMVCYDMNKMGEYSEKFLFSFIVIPSIYIFYLVKQLDEKLRKISFISKLINTLGECSFGVYLFGFYLQPKLIFVYRYVIRYLGRLPLISCLIYVTVVVMTAFLITYILRKNSLFRKIL